MNLITTRHNQHAKRHWHKMHPLMRKNAVLDAKLARMIYNKGNEPPGGSFIVIPMHTAKARTQELLVDVMQMRRRSGRAA